MAPLLAQSSPPGKEERRREERVREKGKVQETEGGDEPDPC
jgi:hypothetical protein